MNINIILSFSAFSGLIIFLGGIIIIPSIGNASIGVTTYSFPPKPTTTQTSYVIPISATFTPVASPVASPVAISSLIEIPPPDNLAIITGSIGFKLILIGIGIFIVSMIGFYYKKNEEGIPHRIVPYQAPILKEIIIKPSNTAVTAVTASNANIYELRPQTQAPFQHRPPLPYPPHGPVLKRTFKYPPPYEAFNKK